MVWEEAIADSHMVSKQVKSFVTARIVWTVDWTVQKRMNEQFLIG